MPSACGVLRARYERRLVVTPCTGKRSGSVMRGGRSCVVRYRGGRGSQCRRLRKGFDGVCACVSRRHPRAGLLVSRRLPAALFAGGLVGALTLAPLLALLALLALLTLLALLALFYLASMEAQQKPCNARLRAASCGGCLRWRPVGTDGIAKLLCDEVAKSQVSILSRGS